MRSFSAVRLLIAACAASLLLMYRHRPAFLAPGRSEGEHSRRVLLGSWILGLGGVSGAAPAQAQSVFSTEKWDGSFLDTSKDCKEAEIIGTPEGTCLRNSNALGGYATIRGRDRRVVLVVVLLLLLLVVVVDEPGGDEWEVFSEYDDKEIRLPFKERGGPKAVGKWFSNKKEGIKGIKWMDGTVWEKMDYKIFPAPNEMTEAIGKAPLHRCCGASAGEEQQLLLLVWGLVAEVVVVFSWLACLG
eukprot:Skav208892  [mRNA]  locus=scaffold270:419380:428460:- [translate_table: standard]